MMFTNLSIAVIAVYVVTALAAPVTTTATTIKATTGKPTTIKPTKTTTTTTTGKPTTIKPTKTTTTTTTVKATTSKPTTTTTTTTTTTKSTPTPSCTAPAPPKNRPACSSNGSGSFSLKLATCGNKFDGLFLEPLTNSTSNSINVYTTSSGPAYDYLYPPGTTYGPWAWRATFAGTDTDSQPAPGLQTVVFNSGAQINCAIAKDGVPFTCSGQENPLAFYYVNVNNGQLFASVGKVTKTGFPQVVPYIFQGCTT